MRITVFQALTLLAAKYRDDATNKEIYQDIKRLYLSGVRSEEDNVILEKLLQDESINHYEISAEKQDINEDPVRRYFESHLTHETLIDSLDLLDKRRLERHFKSISSYLSIGSRINHEKTVYSGTRKGGRKLSGTAKEYAEGIRVLARDDTFESLMPEKGCGKKSPEDILLERKEKMTLLAKCSHAAMAVVRKKTTPVDLYSEKGYVYDQELRGRQGRFDPENPTEGQITDGPNALRHNALGIMRSYMPLPADDALNAKHKAEYFRPADASTYVEGATVPEEMFATKVTPFVNSISGTTLIQLRMAAQLLNDQKFVYLAQGNNKEQIEAQLKNYFKCFVAYMIYNSGGHSLKEFVGVFELEHEAIKEAFKDLPGFSDLTLENLFKVENDSAFERAVDKAIDYNAKLIAKRKVHEELVSPKSKAIKKVAEGADELTVIARSRLKSPKERMVELNSLERKNKIIDKAYNIYTDPTTEDVVRKEVAKVLVKKLKIQLQDPEDTQEVYNKIILRMHARSNVVRKQLFSSGTILANRLDEAWEIYKNTDRTFDDRAIAQSFLIFVLDIKVDDIPEGSNLNEVLQQLMLERELWKSKNQEFIPRHSAISSINEELKARVKATEKSGETGEPLINAAILDKELLDVNEPSKRKDRGEGAGRLQGIGTQFFNAEERDMFRTLLRNGIFVDNSGNLIDTSNSISHGKRGFAAFTLNVNGELSIFQHISHDKTGIAHSSMNAGAPVVAAGEIQIKKGRIMGITDHSGHYRPSAYSIYKALNYFRQRGADISGADVYLFRDPAEKLGIRSSHSKKYPHFHVCKAEDLCNSYRANFRDAIENVQMVLAKYQTPSFINFLLKLKDFFTFSTLTSDRQELAKEMSRQLMELSEDINKLQTVEEMDAFSEKLKEITKDIVERNKRLSLKYSKSTDNGRLSKISSLFNNKVNELALKVEMAKEQKASGRVSSDEEILSDSSALKNIGRKAR